MFFHHPDHPVPIPLYVRLSCDATASSSAAAAGGASTSSSTGGAVGRVDLKDRPDEFLMYVYKVKRCFKTRRHDWSDCPYAHRGEKARRRDPAKYRYSGIACPEFRQRGECPRGQGCEYAHGVFEFWLHPTRYRTRVCENGDACTRRICFFAHTPEQLRPEVFRDCFRCGIGRCVAKPMRIETPALPAADPPSVAVPVAALPAADLPAVALPATVGAPSSSSKDVMDEERGKGLEGGDGDEFLDFSEFGWVEELLAEGEEGGEGLGRGVE